MVINKYLLVIFILVSIFGITVSSGVTDVDDPYADEVYSFTQGYVWDTTKAEPPGTWGATDVPEEALGGPKKDAASGNAYFVSLGSRPAGEIILKFTDTVLIDGEDNSGYDLAIHEFGAADDAHIYLSNDYDEDGQPDGWVYLGYTKTDASLSRQVGSHPDYITGQSSSSLFLFDVAGKLEKIGGWASYIRIVDDDTGRKDPNFTDGFDLNAVELLNYCTPDELNQPDEEPVPDDDGDCDEPDVTEPGDGCPTCGNDYNDCDHGCGWYGYGCKDKDSTCSHSCDKCGSDCGTGCNDGGNSWSWVNTCGNNCDANDGKSWSWGNKCDKYQCNSKDKNNYSWWFDWGSSSKNFWKWW